MTKYCQQNHINQRTKMKRAKVVQSTIIARLNIRISSIIDNFKLTTTPGSGYKIFRRFKLESSITSYKSKFGDSETKDFHAYNYLRQNVT